MASFSSMYLTEFGLHPLLNVSELLLIPKHISAATKFGNAEQHYFLCIFAALQRRSSERQRQGLGIVRWVGMETGEKPVLPTSKGQRCGKLISANDPCLILFG